MQTDYKILKVSLQNLFPKNIQFAYVELYIYPFDKTYFYTTKSIYLPSLVGKGYTNYNGVIEFQLIPNDLLEPKPNYYVVVVMYKGKKYVFVAYIPSTLQDLVIDLKDVLVKRQDNNDCQNNNDFVLFGETVYI